MPHSGPSLVCSIRRFLDNRMPILNDIAMPFFAASEIPI
jgi:hypothetical protein